MLTTGPEVADDHTARRGLAAAVESREDRRRAAVQCHRNFRAARCRSSGEAREEAALEADREATAALEAVPVENLATMAMADREAAVNLAAAAVPVPKVLALPDWKPTLARRSIPKEAKSSPRRPSMRTVEFPEARQAAVVSPEAVVAADQEEAACSRQKSTG